MAAYIIGDNILPDVDQAKDLRVLVYNTLSRSPQCEEAAGMGKLCMLRRSFNKLTNLSFPFLFIIRSTLESRAWACYPCLNN